MAGAIVAAGPAVGAAEPDSGGDGGGGAGGRDDRAGGGPVRADPGQGRHRRWRSDRETQANTALAAANENLSRSRAAVQARYELAVEAIRTFHTGVSEDFLLKEVRFKDLRDRLLRSASGFYEKLGALLGRETDLGSRRALARANFELAEADRAGGAHARMRWWRHRSVAGGAAGAGGRAGGRRGGAGRRRPQPGRRRRPPRIGREDRRGAWRRTARPRPCWRGPRRSRRRPGPRWRPAGRGWAASWPRSARMARRWRPSAWPGPTRRRWPRPTGRRTTARLELADTVNNIGNVLSKRAGKAEAEVEYRDALRIRRELDEANPGVAAFRRGRRRATAISPCCWARPAGPRRPRPSTGRAWRSAGNWSRRTPPSPHSARSLAGGHAGLGIHLAQTGRPEAGGGRVPRWR